MSRPLSLDDVRDCLDGGVPCVIGTVGADGTPNVTYVSQLDYVDPLHVAMSFQFFNKTRENILHRPRARIYTTHGVTGASYLLDLEYLRTEFEGPAFERMRARLAGVASHTGMTGIFRLRGADVYRVLHIAPVPGITQLDAPPPQRLLRALRGASARLAAAEQYEDLLCAMMLAVREDFGIAHGMLLLRDATADKLYTVASCGYPQSGVGSEIALGDGVIGVAAQQRVPIRLNYMSMDYAYSLAQREHVQASGFQELLRNEIPFPGLAEAHSQLAAPILSGDRLLGVLYVESDVISAFSYDHEDALLALCSQFGSMLRAVQGQPEETEPARLDQAPAPQGRPVRVRRFLENDSVFLDDDYLIKGVAGAIFWRLLQEHLTHGRTEFSNRELRLDASLRLPDIGDNLEARLSLLGRRLEERCGWLKLDKTGRGRFRLDVQRPVQLHEVPRA